MARNRKLAFIGISLLLIMSLIVGCSGGYKSQSTNDIGVAESPDMAPAPSMPEEEKPAEGAGDNFGGGATSPLEPEKVITTLYLNFESTEFDKSNDELNRLIEKYKAYVEYSNISYNQHYNNTNYRYGEFVIRVPRDNITSFKTELHLVGNLRSESTNKQDVTKQYRDTESRLNVVEIKEERLLSLLEKAEKIEDIIALENQLSKVIYEKESLKSSLITLDDKVDFSTVNLSIQEVAKATATETVDTSFGTKIKNAISDSLYSFRTTLEDLIIILIYMLPFLIILAVIVFVVVKVLKKLKKDRPQKPNKPLE